MLVLCTILLRYTSIIYCFTEIYWYQLLLYWDILVLSTVLLRYTSIIYCYTEIYWYQLLFYWDKLVLYTVLQRYTEMRFRNHTQWTHRKRMSLNSSILSIGHCNKHYKNTPSKTPLILLSYYLKPFLFWPFPLFKLLFLYEL